MVRRKHRLRLGNRSSFRCHGRFSRSENLVIIRNFFVDVIVSVRNIKRVSIGVKFHVINIGSVIT